MILPINASQTTPKIQNTQFCGLVTKIQYDECGKKMAPQYI
jgi:hypothetical protein